MTRATNGGLVRNSEITIKVDNIEVIWNAE